jgi:hypothetical protein
MKASRRQKRPMLAALLALFCLVPAGAGAQLLFREGEKYENYAFESYRSYDSILFGRDRTPQFDALGQFVMNGINVFELQEFRSISPTSGSIIRKPSRYGSYLNRLVVADDSYGGVTTRFIIGDRIRAKFTPLTLDLAAMNGIRLDSHAKGVSLVLLTSRVDKPIYEAVQNNDHRTHGQDGSEFIPRWATYLMGADLRTQMQGLDVGVSWTNLLRTDSMRQIDEESFRGTLPSLSRLPPEWVVVRLMDQNPDDAVRVRARRPVLLINGEPIVPVIGPYDKLAAERSTLTVTVDDELAVIPPARRDNSNDLVIEDAHVAPSPDGVYETGGDEALLLWFKVPAYTGGSPDSSAVDRIEVELEVAGDYELQLAEVFDGASSNPATYFYSAARSEGTPDNLGAYRRVRVRYGRETGRTLLGAHFNLDVHGWMVRSEYVRNFSFRAYPGMNRRRLNYFDEQSSAWYVNVRRDVGAVTLGGELFNIDADYSTRLNVQDDDLRSIFQLLSSPFSYPTNFHEPRLPDFLRGERTGPTNTIEFDTVDDNDDKDQFPDSYYLQRTTNLETGGRFIEDPDGVFPGLDADLNGRPDINENNNRIPDYYEPFLLYYVSPDAYDYGHDLNNNGVIDQRENDDKPDYPYDTDRRGVHLFGSYDVPAVEGWRVTLGYHDMWAPYGGGQARSSYVQQEYDRRLPRLAELKASYKLKRVHDDIADPVFGLGRDPIYLQPDRIPIVPPTAEEARNPLGLQILEEDPLLFQDSWVHRFYVRGRLIRMPPWNVETSLRWDVNRQQETETQAQNSISDLAMMVRSDWTWEPWRQLQVKPQVKWLAQRRTDGEDVVLEVKETYFFPILRLEYPLSSSTAVKAGVQGLPFLKSRYRNDVTPGADFDSEVYLLQVGNTSNYLGYQVNVNLGYEYQNRRFLDRERADQDVDFHRMFLRVITGLDPVF